jgi:hypothetical protein
MRLPISFSLPPKFLTCVCVCVCVCVLELSLAGLFLVMFSHISVSYFAGSLIYTYFTELKAPPPLVFSRLHIPLWGRGRGSSQRGLETDAEQRAGFYRPAVYRSWASDRVQSSRDRGAFAVEKWGSVHACAESMSAARANRSGHQQ